MSRIERLSTVQTFQAGQELFCEGGPPLAVHCLHAGRVKLSMAGEGGEELVLEFCEPGRLLGLRAVMAGEPFEATAVAAERCSVCTIPREALEEVLEHSPAATRAAARILARELRNAHRRLMEVLQHSVPQRVAHLLVMMKEKSAAEPRMRRADLAHMVGTTPETLSRVLHALKARGAVAVTRTEIRVRDASLLRRIAKFPLEAE
jgi:CRP/FNR family transcriptional regulator